MANITEVYSCDPKHGLSMIDLCQYIKRNNDVCEGGGFVPWVTWTLCQETLVARYLVFAFSLLCLIYFIIILLTSADDYFSVNVSNIVVHFEISQNIAGVTFMAFANGSPDFFNSLASVLSSKHPKAGLAIGELLGGITFVSLIVAGSVAMVQPFKIMRRPFIRDIAFFGVTFAILLVAFLTGNTVRIWLPLSFLVLYILYAVTFLGGPYLRRRFEIAKAEVEDQISRRPTSVDIRVTVVSESETRPTSRQSSYYNHHDSMKTPEVLTRNNSVSSFKQKAINFIDHHHLFVSEDEAPEEKIYISKTRKSIFVTDARSRATSSVTGNHIAPPIPDWLKRREAMKGKNIIQKMWIDVNPWDGDEFKESNIMEKVFFIIKQPIFLAFNITNPGSNEYNKCLTAIQVLICPLIFLTCFQISLIVPSYGGPGIWAYVLVISIIASVIIFYFTDESKEPHYYKILNTFAGFAMSISFIYAVATEIVGIAGLLGLISGMSHEIIGLTVLAWSNSVGDLFSDTAIAKKYPRIGFTSATGGVLFNILFGFGLPFLIAVIQGKEITLQFTPVTKVLLAFVSLSFFYSFCVLVLIRKFKVDKFYAVGLFIIYGAFLVSAILAETGVLKF